MSPEVSRRLGLILGRHHVTPDERDRIISAALEAERWEDIPRDIQRLLAEIERRGAVPDDDLDEPPIDPDVQREVIARLGVIEIDVEDEDSDEVAARILAADGVDEFERYWTGKGLVRWATSPTPWRTLVRLLKKHKGIRDPKGLASHYFHVVFGFWPGHRKGENPVGPG